MYWPIAPEAPGPRQLVAAAAAVTGVVELPALGLVGNSRLVGIPATVPRL